MRLGWILAAPLALALGCSSSNPNANVPFPACAMPADGTFTGTWNTQPFGEMQLTQDGNTIVGCWENPTLYKTGRLEGTLQGCLFLFTWRETDTRVPNQPRTLNGRGVFRYYVEEAVGTGAPVHRFEGTWGYDNDVQGQGTWNGRRTRPEPKPCN